MITFKNRYAECDNLDDSYNDNVLRNCYNKEYRKNFRHLKNNKSGNLRYTNFNDTRAINNNNYNFNSYQRQNAYTPFPKLPQINNNMNYNNISYNDQNFVPSRSSPSMPSIVSYNNNNMNYRQTPLPRYNNNNLNNSFDNSGFISNNYDGNISNDNIQFYNDSNNILNISNDSQHELEEIERERKLLLEQEKLNQLDFELRYLRQKRNADLQRRLAEQQQNLEYINKIKNEIEIENDYNNAINNNIRRINYNYSINNNNRRNYYDNYYNKYLEEKLKSNVMNDKFYMNELIGEINRMKISQEEANQAFQLKMNDLVRQNESMKKVNEKMIEKIIDMKLALANKKQTDTDTNNDDTFDYLYEKKLRGRQKSRFYNGNDGNDDNNQKNDNFYSIRNDRYADFDSLDYTIKNKDNKNYKSLDNYKLGKYYLGKKDKDIEEFNMLNKNIVNKDNSVVVTPLKFNEDDSKYVNDFKVYNPPYNNNSRNRNNNTIKNTNSNNKNEELYSLIRKNNDRLEKLKELEEKSL